RAGVRLANERGVTAVHDKDGWLGALRLWRQLEERGSLSLRVWQSIPYDKLDDAVSIGMRSGLGSPYLRLGYLKVFMDGTLGSQASAPGCGARPTSVPPGIPSRRWPSSRRSARPASRLRGLRATSAGAARCFPATTPTWSCSTATHGTTSTRRSSRRWSAAAGCTTHRPGEFCVRFTRARPTLGDRGASSASSSPRRNQPMKHRALALLALVVLACAAVAAGATAAGEMRLFQFRGELVNASSTSVQLTVEGG